MKMKHLAVRILDNKLSFLWAALLGTFLGIYFPEFSKSLGVFGQSFISIMQLCVVPIVIASIAISIAYFTASKTKQPYFRIFLVFALALILCSLIGVLTGIVFDPGSNIDPSSSEKLNEILASASQSQRGINEPLETRLTSGFFQIIQNAIPSNVFVALASGDMLKIIVFSVIFGVALGEYANDEANIMHIIRQILDIFMKIFDAIIFIFPIILVLTVAHDTAEIGPNTLVGMGSFLAKYFAGAGVMFIIATMVIKLRTRATFMQLFEIMRDPIIISLATQNTTAAIPSSIQSLQRFGYEKNLVQLLIPIGSIIARFGTVLYFGFCAVFALQLYGIQPGASEIVLLALITIFAGLATAGQTGPLTMTALAVVLTPIGIPVSGILPMLLTIDALADPIRTLTNTYTNCAATSLIGKPIGPLLTIEQLERDETAEAKKTTPF